MTLTLLCELLVVKNFDFITISEKQKVYYLIKAFISLHFSISFDQGKHVNIVSNPFSTGVSLLRLAQNRSRVSVEKVVVRRQARSIQGTVRFSIT